MTRVRPVLRVFLASPGDVTQERALVERVIAELNTSIARNLGWHIELVRWEDMIPNMGRPQQVVFEQADIDDTDTFIGILWNRFGTPSGRADSGTEEEFNVAYRHWQENGSPRIHFYFSQLPENLRTADELDQKGKVIAFRKKICEIGLIREYDTIRDFEVAVRDAIIADLLKNKDSLEHDQVGKRRALRVGANSEPATSRMILIPAGPFLCGSDLRQRTLDYDYFIDATPVTNAQYAEFIDQTGYLHHQGDPSARLRLERLYSSRDMYPDHPVTSISWYDATACAAWLGKRLPSSDEWEKAARGTDGLTYPWGNTFSPEKCNSKESRLGRTTEVGKYENGLSPFGVYDMAGNVFEWVLDWAAESRFSSVPQSEKVNRGGSFNREAGNLMCWHTESDPPSTRMTDVGFRCVRLASDDPRSRARSEEAVAWHRARSAPAPV